jgi:hypothetical protein
MQPTMTDLATALDDGSWIDVVSRLADTLALDEMQALLVGIKCAEDRRLLPPSEHGRPLETEPLGPSRGALKP